MMVAVEEESLKKTASQEDGLVLFETSAKTDSIPKQGEQSPASYTLSGYSRRIHHFFEILLPEEFRPGMALCSTHAAFCLSTHGSLFTSFS